MEISTLASAESPSGSGGPPQKRSRTGCMTCRNRRRKCDEGKPACQNCISKGFQCRYAAAFQILGKHNFTPEVNSDVKYATVRFVSDGGDDGDNENLGSEKKIRSATAAGNRHNSFSPSQTNSVVTFDTHEETGQTMPADESNSTPSFDRYEFALHGLIALGSNSGATATYSPAPVGGDEPVLAMTHGIAGSNTVDSALEYGNVQRRPTEHQTGTGRASPQRCDPIGLHSPDLSPLHANLKGCEGSDEICEGPNSIVPNPTGIPTTHVVAAALNLEHLKFYRYQIAPWLDICDTDQHFGVTLLAKSTRIPRLRTSVVHLAAGYSSMAWASADTNVGKSTLEEETNSNHDSDVAIGAVVDALDFLADAVPNLATFWLRDDTGRSATLLLERLLLLLASSSLNSCTYWLVVRLTLSCALMTGNNRIPLPFLIGEHIRSMTDDWKAQCAYDAIALCVDSTMFAQGDDDRWLQQRYGLNRVEMWKALVQGLAHWYMHRPRTFQPIVDLYPDDCVLADDDYPTIIFTSGAALLANQLYHTGMLLLLQNRPRFANKPSQNSPSMSTVWHAHRVCGIAIQNDRPGWWDPCLVASLVVAGHTATHASQHNAIIGTLDSVQRLSGWIIDPCVDKLKNGWQLADSL